MPLISEALPDQEWSESVLECIARFEFTGVSGTEETISAFNYIVGREDYWSFTGLFPKKSFGNKSKDERVAFYKAHKVEKNSVGTPVREVACLTFGWRASMLFVTELMFYYEPAEVYSPDQINFSIPKWNYLLQGQTDDDNENDVPQAGPVPKDFEELMGPEYWNDLESSNEEKPLEAWLKVVSSAIFYLDTLEDSIEYHDMEGCLIVGSDAYDNLRFLGKKEEEMKKQGKLTYLSLLDFVSWCVNKLREPYQIPSQ